MYWQHQNKKANITVYACASDYEKCYFNVTHLFSFLDFL